MQICSFWADFSVIFNLFVLKIFTKMSYFVVFNPAFRALKKLFYIFVMRLRKITPVNKL
ncbi:hypothetical protein CGEO_0250 [Campylobacter geochelonis]|nr:hypothetical protein CGEO_0250 [Campylobacter geochelonis]